MTAGSPSVGLAAKILSAYVARNSVSVGSLPDLLCEVHRSITALGAAPQAPVRRATEAQILASIQPESLISFEDGKPYKTLRRHLTIRGLTPEAYKAKWGLPMDYPMVSAAYSARRSTISREIGHSQRMRMAQAAE